MSRASSGGALDLVFTRAVRVSTEPGRFCGLPVNFS